MSYFQFQFILTGYGFCILLVIFNIIKPISRLSGIIILRHTCKASNDNIQLFTFDDVTSRFLIPKKSVSLYKTTVDK